MNAKEKNQNAMKAVEGNLDEMIYQAMVGLGWLFPQTIEEVEIAEEQMDQEAAELHTVLPTAEDILKKIASINSGANAGAPAAEQLEQKQPLLLMLRQRARMKASAIAESLEVTALFLSDISSFSAAIPQRIRKEIARLVTVRLPGITEQDVLDSFDHSSYEPVAAFRDKPFDPENIDYEKIVLRSDMSEERKLYWLGLARDE